VYNAGRCKTTVFVHDEHFDGYVHGRAHTTTLTLAFNVLFRVFLYNHIAAITLASKESFIGILIKSFYSLTVKLQVAEQLA